MIIVLKIDDFIFELFPEAIKEKAFSGLSARMLAGYAWKWTAAGEGNANGQIDDVLIVGVHL